MRRPSLTKWRVNHTLPNGVTQRYAAYGTIVQLREPAQRIAHGLERGADVRRTCRVAHYPLNHLTSKGQIGRRTGNHRSPSRMRISKAERGMEGRWPGPTPLTPTPRTSHGLSQSAAGQRPGRKRLELLAATESSLALALSESLTMIGKLLGHTQVRTTARYAHLARNTVKTSAARIGVRIERDLDVSESESPT